MVAGWGVCGVPVGAPAMLLHHSLFGGLDQVRLAAAADHWFS